MKIYTQIKAIQALISNCFYLFLRYLNFKKLDTYKFILGLVFIVIYSIYIYKCILQYYLTF